MVFNNLLVDICILGSNSFGDDGAITIGKLATSLHNYLSPRSVHLPQARTAEFDLRDVSELVVPAGKPFTAVIAHVENLSEEMAVHVSRSNPGQSIISTGFGKKVPDPKRKEIVRELHFFALEKNTADMEVVDVTVSAAHCDTFYPTTKSFKVVVK